MLWAILTLMLAVAVTALVLPLFAPARHSRHTGVTELLKTQLAEIEVEKNAGLLAADDASAFSGEIKRRILAEGRSAEPSLSGARPRPGLAIALAVVVIAAAASLYAKIGRPGLRSAETTQPESAVSHSAPALLAIIDRLKTHLGRVPADHEGWNALGWAYLVTSHPAQAANAYGRAIAIEPNNAADRSAQGDALVQAAGGEVTPAALSDFRAALTLDAKEPRARYFLGLWKEQQGDHSGAMADWIALLKGAPPNAPWFAQVRDFVERDARAHGDDISATLPPPR